MRLLKFISIARRFTLLLIVMGLFMPSLHVLSASEAAPQHGAVTSMSAGCNDEGCPTPTKTQSCIEHCLNVNQQQSTTSNISEPIQKFSSLVSAKTTLRPALRIYRAASQNTGPPRHTYIHLTNQQKE